MNMFFSKSLAIHILLYFYALEHFKGAMEKRMIILKQARENIGKAQDKQKKDFDKRHHCPNTFKVSS